LQSSEKQSAAAKSGTGFSMASLKLRKSKHDEHGKPTAAAVPLLQHQQSGGDVPTIVINEGGGVGSETPVNERLYFKNRKEFFSSSKV
jgi:hypothetical protein